MPKKNCLTYMETKKLLKQAKEIKNSAAKGNNILSNSLINDLFNKLERCQCAPNPIGKSRKGIFLTAMKKQMSGLGKMSKGTCTTV